MLRYPDTHQARILLAEAAREIHRLCQQAQRNGNPEDAFRLIIARVDMLLDLCRQRPVDDGQDDCQRS